MPAIHLYRYVRSEKYRSFENLEILEQLHPADLATALAAERLIRAMPAGSREAAKLLVIRSLTRTRGDNAGAGQQSQDET